MGRTVPFVVPPERPVFSYSGKRSEIAQRSSRPERKLLRISGCDVLDVLTNPFNLVNGLNPGVMS